MPADPDGNTTDFLLTVILFAFYVVSAFYAFAESYFQNINENRLKKDVENGNKKAGALQKLLEKRSERFSSLQFGLFFNGFCICALSSAMFLPYLYDSLLAAGIESSLSVCLGLLIIVICSSFIFFVFSDFIPKKIALHNIENTKYRFVGILTILYRIFMPYLKIVNLFSDGILRLFGFDPKNLIETVTEEEIMMLVGESEERGVIEETEKDMIENILDFNDTTASEIMTHRTDIFALPDTATIEEIVALSVEEGLSRIPVYQDDIDSVLGICYVKDLLPYVGKTIPDIIDIKNLVRPAYFIPESKKCSHLFSEMTERKVQIAIIVDEYGGTSGLVTLEDLIESILGNIQDEYDNEEEEILKMSDNEFTVEGTTPIDEISDLTDVELPEGDYDTIAGLVTEKLGRILKEDEHPVIELMGLKITVIEVDEQRISKLLIEKTTNKQD